ncbi:SNF7 family protein [Toxoplasma gondii TgCatPRC2]|uniref:SNF7 family protein n=6 Tax=Toxoplasma gondii TaxID=5811 RepID=A0A125YL71_TOXGV|nr:SNF7 family protein [Toxoplasma gondii ME49]ESS35359.1 SNF7 family protein [Toxoplasma gondii VEG]KFG36874.1 SNF7 family protein [Toxoplasma gondii GAB2-2007-GAL-DOM2]KYF40163.1 SNF7 family protein [Toxoplasma gondii ARI]KYK65712.1 SNF7 family protein [Toxoplasma gondii TgCatPRC2]PIM00784.1 SNF7 family protein [Toxoplasma gondii COUG]|eukprot:XP_018635335.1 SNF7 family protein [Toxoplasma gondii ME49]
MGNKHSVIPLIFDMKIKARELKRQSERCYRESEGEKGKVKAALQKNNSEGARVFAQNFIRKQQEGLHCLQLSSKLDAVASRLDAAHRSQQMSKQMRSAAYGLSNALRTLDGGTSLRQMEEFAKLFDDLDVRSDSVSTLLDASTSTSIPLEQVDDVLKHVATAAKIHMECEDFSQTSASLTLKRQEHVGPIASPAFGQHPISYNTSKRESDKRLPVSVYERHPIAVGTAADPFKEINSIVGRGELPSSPGDSIGSSCGGVGLMPARIWGGSPSPASHHPQL